jgi:hypothetical protein
MWRPHPTVLTMQVSHMEQTCMFLAARTATRSTTCFCSSEHLFFHFLCVRCRRLVLYLPTPACCSDVLVFDTLRKTWVARSLRGTAPASRQGHVAVILGDLIFMGFGGVGLNVGPTFNDMNVGLSLG